MTPNSRLRRGCANGGSKPLVPADLEDDKSVQSSEESGQSYGAIQLGPLKPGTSWEVIGLAVIAQTAGTMPWGSADAEPAVETSAMYRAWSLLTVDESERQFGGNLGYGDVLGSTYLWDSTVPNHRSVRSGDLAVLRNGTHVLGVGWIDDVQTETATKVRRRCPHCGSTAFKPRKQLTPRYKCSPCKNLFDNPTTEEIRVTVYVCEYGRTWRSTTDLLVTDLSAAYLNHSAQQSMRPLDPELLTQALGQAYDFSLRWWVEATNPDLPSGHHRRLGRVRIGQAQFRQVLRQRFGDRCFITGPQPAQAVEAAHLYRYCETPSHDISGGVLLRRDLHTLFDHFLIAIDPSDWAVRLGPTLQSFPDLAQLDGRRLAMPPQVRPRKEYLAAHLEWATDLWNRHESDTLV